MNCLVDNFIHPSMCSIDVTLLHTGRRIFFADHPLALNCVQHPILHLVACVNITEKSASETLSKIILTFISNFRKN